MSRFVLTAQLQLQAPNNVAQVVSQIQNQLNNVSVNVQVRGSAQANQQLQQITQSTQAATTAAGRMGNAFAVSIRRFAAFSIATRAVGLFTSTLSDAVKTAIDFERELIKISQVTGRSVSSLRDLTDSVTNLSTGLGVTSESLLEVTTVLTQAGLSSDDTKIALESLAKAALAPNFDSIQETAEGAIAILAQFKQGVGALEGQLSSIDAVAGAFAVEAGDLIDVIRRSGGVFKASGGSLNELLALFTSVRATTRESAESIGTGLRTIFTRIQRPETIEFLKRFGVELVDLNGKFVGPYEAIKRLSEAISGLGEGDLTFIKIAEELGGFRQIGKVLPLLQQFSTAQAALNVAQTAGNGLTKNAETAQASLAIRIIKVREEFLALVRSMTETPTFQVMANTALALASALIKIADSIKPLLPLLGAVAAFKAVKGIGGFLGGVGAGLTSGRTFHSGGKVQAFATGGLVPGSGNSDTVPAMLTPGEFVIRKNSVQKLGANNLAHMNNGGTVQKFATGGTADKIAQARSQKLSPNPNKEKTKTYKDGSSSSPVEFEVKPKSIGAFFMNPAESADDSIPFAKQKFQLTNKQLLSLNGIQPKTLRDDNKFAVGQYANAILKPGSVSTFYPSLTDISRGSFSEIIQSNVQQKLTEAVVDTANFIQSNKLLDIPPIDSNEALLRQTAASRIAQDKGAIRTTSGYLFEGVIDAITGAKPASGNANFDFPPSSLQGNKPRLASLFGNPAGIQNLAQADAKASYSSKIISGGAGSGSILSKIINSINDGKLGGIKMIAKKSLGGIIQKFAFGGRAKGIEGAPLVDDILQASGSILPRPSAAIQALIKAGGGAVDVDRTLKRTVGDTAYAKAPTPGAKDASLNTYFRDEVKRLQDLKSAPITQFGKELQAAIKNGQLDARKISIISKSKRVKGAAEYLSSQFGIPIQNMIFTQGASKQPAIDAIRNKGSRVDRVKFATGGNVGTDTVPALLTPGEFVVNKSSAQRIGYGNLHRMNTVGKYAKGGVVQTFATGGTATGGTRTSGDRVGAQAFNLNPKIFAVLDKTVFSLADLFRGLGAETTKTVQAFSLIEKSVPQLVDSIRSNSIANKRTKTSQEKIAVRYAEMVISLQNQGKSNDEIKAAMSRYVQALDRDSNAKLNSAQATTARNSAVAASPSVSAPPTASAQPSGSLAAFNAAFQTNTQAVQQNTNSQQQASSTAATVANNNKMFAASMAVSLLQGFLPAVDENSSMLLKFSTSVLGIVSTLATVGFALEAFGVSLSLQELTSLDKMANRLGLVFDNVGRIAMGMYDSIRNVITGQVSETAASTASATADTAEAAASSAATASDLGNALGGFAIGATVAYMAVKTFSDALRKSAEDMNKKKIEAGDVEGARKAGENLGSVDFAEVLQNYGAITGTVLGGAAGAGVGFLGGIAVPVLGNLAGTAAGTAVGAAAGGITGAATGRTAGNFLNAAFGPGDAAKAMGSVSASAAQFVQTNKVLENSSDKAAKALENVQAGTISLRNALDSLAVETQSSVDAMKLAKEANTAEEKVVRKQNTGGLRTFGAYLTNGYVDSNEEVQARKNNMTQRTQDAQRVGQQQLRTLQPAMQQQMTETASSGGSFDDFLSSLSDAEFELLNLTDGAMRNAASSFENISKEIQRAQNAFAAMNLGMQNVQGAAAAAALGVNNYVASQQAGNIGLEQSLAVLEASVTSAAQGISDADFGKALSDASEVLYEFGANPEQVTKFQRNVSAVNEVQKNQSSIFGGARDKLAENIRGSVGAEGRRTAFTNSIDEQLAAAGYDDATRQRFKDASANMSDDQLQKIGTGDFTAFEEAINELGKKTLEQVNGPMKAAYEIQKQLNELTKQRIEAERQLMNAQLEASNVRMEAMDIAAKYGGPKVTPEMRAKNTVEQANIQARGINGVTDLKTGSAAELSARTQQLSARQAEITGIKTRAAQGDAAATQQLQGESGTKLAEEEKRIADAAKSQIQATRDLIKSKEEELRIIKEKNQLEKSSIDALISGDIEKFFEQKAAVGAQAAIATGDQRLIGQFGMSALGGAAQETKRQQEAGVQTLYGQQLAGPGGLTERAYGSAISASGIQNPLAMAQVAAGSTGAENALESDIRDLAATMGPAADIQVQAANGQLQAAELQYKAATAKGQEAVAQMQSRANGGMIYANRGIFVPRGTDTVPAMLTPGEFVVNRAAVQRGNNLQILQSMNRGVSSSAPAASSQSGNVAAMANGGIVRYREAGSNGPEAGGTGINAEALNAFAAALSQFNTELTKNIQTLASTKFQITLSPTNINVNLTGTSFLSNLAANIKQDLLKFLGQEITNYSVGNDGKLRKSGSTLGTVT